MNILSAKQGSLEKINVFIPIVLLLNALILIACETESTTQAQDDLPVGDLPVGDFKDTEILKADGTQNWGSALTCKIPPDLEALKNPKITLSIDGLTLRLTDETTGFDRVYPVGVGAIDFDSSSETFGESLSYAPILKTKSHKFKITPSSIQPCKTWLASANAPVFAGLPFLSFFGNYAIHGPIDQFRQENGGTLRRGYVSHGCFRMEAADVLEVYALIKDVAEVPVFLYREAEIGSDGLEVEVEDRWIGDSCVADQDCAYEGGYCQINRYSNLGFCSRKCDGFCPDRDNLPTTACIPNGEGSGMCVPRDQDENRDCRPYHQMTSQTQTLWNRDAKVARVCAPGTTGFIGDACFESQDCMLGMTCLKQVGSAHGICTQSCDRSCTDITGKPTTACVAVQGEIDGMSIDGDGYCVRQCQIDANRCQHDEICEDQNRFNRETTVMTCKAQAQ